MIYIWKYKNINKKIHIYVKKLFGLYYIKFVRVINYFYKVSSAFIKKKYYIEIWNLQIYLYKTKNFIKLVILTFQKLQKMVNNYIITKYMNNKNNIYIKN